MTNYKKRTQKILHTYISNLLLKLRCSIKHAFAGKSCTILQINMVAKAHSAQQSKAVVDRMRTFDSGNFISNQLLLGNVSDSGSNWWNNHIFSK